MRIPAETFPPGKFIQDEMDARGWSLDDLHARISDPDPVTHLAVDLTIHIHDRDIIMDARTARALAEAFGNISEQYWINLDRAWRGVQ